MAERQQTRTSIARIKDELVFDIAQTDSELQVLEPEWAHLFAQTGTRNPFAHPAWMIPWLRTFVPNADERVVVVVRRAGELVGIAPFHRQRYGFGPLSARVLQLAGASPRGHDRLTEMSGVLVVDADRRRIMRSLIRHLATSAGHWDWLGITLPADQGWFETAWLPERWQSRGANVLHKGLRASVVLPLPRTWQELRLKRNQREALRRSRNRLLALDQDVEIDFATGSSLAPAVDEAVALHRRRASLEGHLRHDDYFTDAAVRALLQDAASRWSVYGNAAVARLRLDGEPVAARLVLDANRGTFLSFSGADPDRWRLCAPTAVVEASIRRAIEHGMDAINFSTSPDSSKLRWSEALEFEHEFVVVPPARRSRLLFAAWWQARTRRTLSMGRRLVSEQAAES